MRIDIWSDIVCPFCYIGKRHLELALDGFEHADDVELVWHSFELDPTIEREATGTLVEKIASKYGISAEQSEASQKDVEARAAAVGLTFNWREAKYGNTFDAHRIIHLAATRGLATEAETRLMRAYFTEGVQIGDRAELQRLGEEIGLPADDVRRVLDGEEFATDVRADEQQARGLGISGVPFFVLDGKYGVSGAQPVEMLGQALTQVWDETHGATTSTVEATPAPGEVGHTHDDHTDDDHTHDGHAHPAGTVCEGDACSI